MRNKSLTTVLKATVLGAVAMYIFDPVLGRRRRALARRQDYPAANSSRGSRPHYHA
jgi:hypothetical protein